MPYVTIKYLLFSESNTPSKFFYSRFTRWAKRNSYRGLPSLSYRFFDAKISDRLWGYSAIRYLISELNRKSPSSRYAQYWQTGSETIKKKQQEKEEVKINSSFNANKLKYCQWGSDRFYSIEMQKLEQLIFEGENTSLLNVILHKRQVNLKIKLCPMAWFAIWS